MNYLSSSWRRGKRFRAQTIRFEWADTFANGLYVVAPGNMNRIINSLRVPLLDADSDIDEIIRPNRYLLTFVGLWPLKSNASYATKIFATFRIIALIIFMIFCIVPEIFVTYISWGDVAVLTENGVAVLTYSLILAKASYVLACREDFYIVYELMREFWNMAKNKEERDKIVELTNHARFWTVLFSYLTCLDGFSFISGSLAVTFYNRANANGTNYDHRLPIGVWYGFDTQSSPNYELLFIFQSLSLVMACPACVGLDLSVMLILMHIAGQFRLISFRLKLIGRKISNKHELSSSFLREMTMEIKACIIHQQRVLSAFRFVERLLGPLNFFQFIVAAIEIGFVGWALIEADDDLARKVKFSLLLAVVTLQLMFGCWTGEVIIGESTEIGRVVSREIPWFTLPVSMQQDFKLVICMSQKQCEVTAIGLQTMHLKKMSEVFNTAFSYLALLRSIEN